MRKKNFLRILSVTAAAFCAALVLVFCGNPAGGDDEKDQSKKLELATLDVVFKGESESLLKGDNAFSPGKHDYTVAFTEADGGRELMVTASVTGASVSITVGGNELPGGVVKVPEAATANIIVNIAISAKDSPPYTITLSPPQSSSKQDYAIKSLYLAHKQGDPSMIDSISGTNWSVYGALGETSMIVKVEARSEASPIKISYGNIEKSGTGAVTATISPIPQYKDGGASEASQKLEILIFKAEGYNNGVGESCTYSVTINPYSAQRVDWEGTVEYTGSAGFEVTEVLAQNARGETAVASLLGYDGNARKWKVNADEFYRPSLFSVSLEKIDNSGDEPKTITMQSKAFYLTAAQLSSRNGITLEVSDDDTGVKISNANDFIKYLDGNSDRNANYGLASDIDLSVLRDGDGNLIAWTGATGYAGKFYGNGFKIKNLILEPTKTKNNTGHNIRSVALFNTILSGCQLENFTVEVSTRDPDFSAPDSGLPSLYFGAVAGMVRKEDSPTPTVPAVIKNVKVIGTLELNRWNYDVNMGGLVGVLQTGALDIIDCVSELNITIKDGAYTASAPYNSFGGLVGTAGGILTIRNSYSTGTISVKSTANRMLRVGGLIGTIWNADTAERGQGTTITNSYSTATLIGDCTDRTGWTVGSGNLKELSVGGLVGTVETEKTLTIENSVAFNTKALALANGNDLDTERYLTVKYANFGRLLGGSYAPAQNVTMTNNRAVLGMEIGYAPGTFDETAGDVNDRAGLGVSSDSLKTAEVWKALGFTEEVWNFKNISQGKGPTLN